MFHYISLVIAALVWAGGPLLQRKQRLLCKLPPSGVLWRGDLSVDPESEVRRHHSLCGFFFPSDHVPDEIDCTYEVQQGTV